MQMFFAHTAAGSICTDTRSLRPGQWFLALRGANFDGHTFIHHAIERNCCGIIVEAAALGTASPHDGVKRSDVRLELGGFRGCVIAVESTMHALSGLASDVRRRFNGVVVGITGSCGKTTTKEMVAACLSAGGRRVHRTQVCV